MAETIRSLEGLRWSCSGCGACCRAGYGLGPVGDKTAENLDALGIRELWEPAKDGWFEMRTGPDGKEWRYLKTTEDGACLFLRDDGLCGMHGLLGAEVKPWFCRRFPLTPIRDPNGFAVVTRPTCHGHHDTFDTAPEITRAELEQAVAETPAIRHVDFAPEVVEVVPGRGVDLDDWMYLEGRMLQALDGTDDRSPWDGVRTVRDVLSGTLGGFPEPNPAQAEHALQATLQALEQVLRAVIAGSDETSGPHHDRLESALGFVQRARQAPAGEPELEPRTRRWLDLNLRSAILGKRIHSTGPVAAGLGLHLVSLDIFARAAAVQPVPPDAFGTGWAMWFDLLANRAMTATLRVVRPALVDRLIRA